MRTGKRWARLQAERSAEAAGHRLGNWRVIHGGISESRCVDCGRAVTIRIVQEPGRAPVVWLPMMGRCSTASAA